MRCAIWAGLAGGYTTVLESHMKKSRRRYYTGLVANNYETRRILRAVRGAGWTARFQKTRWTETAPLGREVIIAASSRIAAQRALNLIRAALLVVLGEPLLFDADL